MSATGSKEDLASKTDDANTNNAIDRPEISTIVGPAFEGSGDHLPSSKEIIPDPQLSTKSPNEEPARDSEGNVTISEKTVEIGAGDQNTDSARPSATEIDICNAQQSMRSPIEESDMNIEGGANISENTVEIAAGDQNTDSADSNPTGVDISNAKQPTKSPNEESDSATISEKTIEIGAGDQNTDSANPGPAEIDISSEPSPVEVMEEPSETSKPGSVTGEGDSENQDDELVLKWDDDDDEDDPIILDTARFDENISKEAVKQSTDDVGKELLDEIDAQIADLDKKSPENKNDADITEIDLCESDEEQDAILTEEPESVLLSDGDKNYDSQDQNTQAKVEQESNVNLNIESDLNIDSNAVKEKTEEELEMDLLKDPPKADQVSQEMVDSTDDNIGCITEAIEDSNDAVTETPQNIDDNEDILLNVEDNNTKTLEVEEKAGNDAEKREESEAMDVDTSNIEVNTIADQTVETEETVVPTLSVPEIDKSNMEVDDAILDTTQENDSSVIIEPREHGLNETNAMIEIPTQELIDVSNLSDFAENENVNITEELLLEGKTVEEIAEAEEVTKADDSVTAVDAEETKNTLNYDDELDNAIKAIVVQVGTENELLSDKIAETEEVFHPKIRVKSLLSMIGDPATSFETNTNADEINSAEKEVVVEEMPNVDEAVPKDDGVPSKEGSSFLDDTQPSTSQMAPDSSEDVADVADSLGLLAESSRVRDDDDEQETSERDDDDDDYDDPDDESSNQMAADQSEDSAQHSEVEMPKVFPSIDNAQDSNDAQDFPDTDADTKDTIASDNALVEDVKQDINIHTHTVPKLETAENNTTEETVKIKDVTQDLEAQIDSFEIDKAAIGEKEIEADMDICKEGAAQEPDLSKEETIAKISKNDDDEPSKAKTDSEKPAMGSPTKPKTPDTQLSPSKMKKLEIAKPKHVLNYVDLEESSSEDDVQIVQKSADKMDATESSNQVEVTSSENTMVAELTPKPTSVTDSQKTPPTSEATTKAASSPKPTAGTKKSEGKDDETPASHQEVFNLDSDDDDATATKEVTTPETPQEPSEKEKPQRKCINSSCSNEPTDKADSSTVAYYHCNRKKKAMVCRPCAHTVHMRAQRLVEGIKKLSPLLQLEMGRASQELVEISDSESEEEVEPSEDRGESIGEKARMLEKQLADMLNATWLKYNMDARLKETQDELTMQLNNLEKESAEVNQMLDDCQLATDRLRCELYASFEVERKELQAINIVDTPDASYTALELFSPNEALQPSQNKRRLSFVSESTPKRAAIPLGYSAIDDKKDTQKDQKATSPDNSKDDDKDVSVVRLSAECAPPSLPPVGSLSRPAVTAGQPVYAMRNAFGSWLRARVIEITPKGANQTFTMCRVRFENKAGRSLHKLLPARCVAYSEPASVRMPIGTRVIALFKDTTAEKMMKRESYYSGIVAEVPNPVNKYRYLVFFDDGYAQYVHHSDTRLVCEFSSLVWEEVHPFSREFVKEYLLAYPERPMVRLHTGQSLKTEWNGKWWVSKVIQVDASLVQVYFEEDKRSEWIYRGSTRLAPLYLELQAAERHRARPMPRNRMQARLNMPYVEYLRSDEPEAAKIEAQKEQQQQEEIRRQRAVAKKSTTAPTPAPVPANIDGLTSRVVYYTPKNAVRPHKMVPHACSPACKRSDVLALSELRTYNPLAKPLLSAWERQIVRFKGHKEVMYRAPCGRRLRNMRELHRYLRTIGSDMAVDLFDFGPNTHCLAEFVLNKCIVGKKDLSHGKENVPVPCVNYYDASLPEFCSYNTERTPTAGVPLNLDPEFLCGCDCTDDCQDKSKCACWKMTLEGARTIGLEGPNVGYTYKRLPEPLPSGIYECNSRCKCKSTCLNRVAQHPLQLKLQVFKTVNRGWGIRALNDVPKGAFLCIYAGNLLTDATANLDGLNEGDEYLAELDYIEVVEQMKEGYEDDIPENDKRMDRKELSKKSDSESEPSTEEEEDGPSKDEIHDYDFQPVGYVDSGRTPYSKRLRKREAKKQKEKEKEEQLKKEVKENSEEDCITISDDEELREPSRFAAQAGMGAQFVSKYRSVRSLFGEDEACYIMDAKVQGNIGRYLNHSCSPNVFVQNVFVDTHDPRFPWVAFFALSHIRAGTELTWNYNYDVGSVPGKALYCYCGAPNCRGRLL